MSTKSQYEKGDLEFPESVPKVSSRISELQILVLTFGITKTPLSEDIKAPRGLTL